MRTEGASICREEIAPRLKGDGRGAWGRAGEVCGYKSLCKLLSSIGHSGCLHLHVERTVISFRSLGAASREVSELSALGTDRGEQRMVETSLPHFLHPHPNGNTQKRWGIGRSPSLKAKEASVRLSQRAGIR